MSPPLLRVRHLRHLIQHAILPRNQLLGQERAADYVLPDLLFLGGWVCEGGGDRVEVSLIPTAY